MQLILVLVLVLILILILNVQLVGIAPSQGTRSSKRTGVSNCPPSTTSLSGHLIAIEGVLDRLHDPHLLFLGFANLQMVLHVAVLMPLIYAFP
jgi:hypothetical protein